MTADVNRDRRVTVPALGSTHTRFVDWSRLCWALLSPVHERLGYRVLAPDRIQGDAVLPHSFTAQSRITSRRSSRDLDLFVPTIQPCAVLTAVKAATRRLWRWPLASLDCGCARRFGRIVVGTKKRLSVEQRN